MGSIVTLCNFLEALPCVTDVAKAAVALEFSILSCRRILENPIFTPSLVSTFISNFKSWETKTGGMKGDFAFLTE